MKSFTYALAAAVSLAVVVPTHSHAQGIGQNTRGMIQLQFDADTSGQAGHAAKDTAASVLSPDSIATLLKFGQAHHALFIVDGVQASVQTVHSLDPQHVATIDMLQSADAIKRYGAQGKHGAVVVTTKAKPASDSSATKPSADGSIQSDSTGEMQITAIIHR